MSTQSEFSEDYENLESIFENICSDFYQYEHKPFESAVVMRSTSRKFDSLYRDHRLNECLQGTFFIHCGFLAKVRKFSFI